MPTVRAYERQVNPNALPGVRRQEYQIPHLQTPAPAVAKTGGAEGVARFAAAGAQTADEIWTQEMERQNQTRVLSAKFEVGKALNNLLYDQQNGALNVHGEPSFGLPDAVGKQLQDVISTTRQGLSNDRQRHEFDAYANQVILSTAETLNDHVAKERYRVDGQKLEGFKQNEVEAALADPNPMRAEEAAANIKDHYQQYGNRWGLPKDTTDAAIASATSQIYQGKIDRYLDNQQDIQARVYYDEHKDSILGSERGKIEAALHKESKLGDAQRVVDSIKPKYTEAMAQTDLEDEIPKLTKDPDVRQQAEQLLGRWFQQKRADTRFREGQASAEAKARLDQMEQNLKNTLDRASKNLAFEQVIPQSRRDLLSEPVERSLRSYWKDITEQKEPKTNPNTFYELYSRGTSDATKDGFAQENLMKYVNQLSRGDFSKLVELQGAIRRGDEKKADELSEGYRTVNEMVEDAMTGFGLEEKPKPGTEGAKQKARLHELVDQDIADFEERHKKKPTKPEIKDMINSHLLPGKLGSWFNILPGSGPFSDVPPTVEDAVARNPKTGEYLVLRNGQWVKP